MIHHSDVMWLLQQA